MLTTPHNGSLKNSHQLSKGQYHSSNNAGERQGGTTGGKRQQIQSKVRSLSQNQGSRKGGLNNILNYN